MIIIFKKIIIFIYSIILFIILLFTFFYLSCSRYKIDLSVLYKNYSTKIYDIKNELISNEGNYNKTYTKYNNISDYMLKAIISIEDKDFYNHNGVSYKGILRSINTNLKSLNFKQGASTITQQLVKNLFLTTEKSIKRKINEINIALDLEKILSKEKILEAYLNNILYGNNIYGIYEASKYYFNKEPINLNLSESALLAGLIQLPNYYNPFTNYYKSIKRRNLCLEKMYNYGYIDLFEYNSAIHEDLNLNYDSLTKVNYYDMYIDYLYEYIKLNNIQYDKSINICMNKDIQKIIYDIFNNKYNHFIDNNQNISIVVIDNKNSSLLGIGSNRFFQRKGINYATIKLQPGSTIKPILDYAPAFEYLNFSPADIICDEPYMYSNNESINNWDYSYLGNISLRKALASSRNIPALKLFQMVGKDRCVNVAKRLGLDINNDIYESEAIGGSYHGYSLLEITNAYSTFSRMGSFKKVSPIYKLDDFNYLDDIKSYQAIKPSTAFFINNILHDVFKNTIYDVKNCYLMAKTGQTNFSSDIKKIYGYDNSRVKDSWVIGYTRDITVGVWTGYDNNKYALTNSLKNVSRDVCRLIIDKFAIKDTTFEIPKGIVYKPYISINNKLYKADYGKYDFFKEGNEPLEYYKERDGHIRI